MKKAGKKRFVSHSLFSAPCMAATLFQYHPEDIKEAQRIAEKEYDITLDNNELSTSRFVTHLKFLGQHFYKRQDREIENLSDLYDYFVKQDVKLENCVNQISVYVKIVFDYDLEQYEKVYLMIHINKVVH